MCVYIFNKQWGLETMYNILLETLGVEAVVLRRAVIIEVFCWIMMLVAVMVDMSSGLRKADALGQKRDSHGLRRSFQKFGDYGKVAMLLMLLDGLAMLFSLWVVPYASGVACVAAIITELLSVRENLKIIKSSAADVTDLIERLISSSSRKDVLEAIKELDTVRAQNQKHSNVPLTPPLSDPDGHFTDTDIKV